MTISSGAFQAAMDVAGARVSARAAAASPASASIPPGERAASRAMRRPRSAATSTASASEMAPVADQAAISPSE